MKVIFLLLVFSLVHDSNCLGCQVVPGEGGRTEFFAAIKKPKGKECVFALKDEAMRVCDHPIDDPNFLLGATIGQVSLATHFVLAWNDQPFGCSCSNGAHSKGIIAIEKNRQGTGFLIMHSTPNYVNFDFQENKIDFSIKDSQTKNGQNFLCISINWDQLMLINDILTVISPNVMYNNFVRVENNEFSQRMRESNYKTFLLRGANLQPNESEDVASRITVLKEIHFEGNVEGTSFLLHGLKDFRGGKKKIRMDNHAGDLESPYQLLQYFYDGGRFDVQSWHSNVKFHMQDIGQIGPIVDIKKLNMGGLVWSTSGNDHSKWAINDKEFVCFGDLNNADTQLKRGGMFMCMKMPALNHYLKASIVEENEPANQKGKRKPDNEDSKSDDDNDDDDNTNDDDDNDSNDGKKRPAKRAKTSKGNDGGKATMINNSLTLGQNLKKQKDKIPKNQRTSRFRKNK